MPDYIKSTSLAFTGTSSEIETYLHPPIQLDPACDYQIALIDFTTYNSIPNIFPGFNRLYYSFANSEARKYIEFPTGSYEVTAIAEYLQSELGGTDIITLQANNNTLQCEIKSVHQLDFTPADSIGSLLGFSANILERDKLHKSDLPVNINPVNSINISCNLVSGSFTNGTIGHILHSFYPAVPPGHKILETPSNLIYLPLNRREKIDNISIRINDQDGKAINFRDEPIFIRIHIKKWVD